MGYRQIKLSPYDHLDDVFFMVFRQLTSSCPWSDQYFCLVHVLFDSILLEYLNKLLVEPIDIILIASMSEEDHYEPLAIMLETFENHLCALTKNVFWMLEVTSSGSRAFAERCRRESK